MPKPTNMAAMNLKVLIISDIPHLFLGRALSAAEAIVVPAPPGNICSLSREVRLVAMLMPLAVMSGLRL